MPIKRLTFILALLAVLASPRAVSAMPFSQGTVTDYNDTMATVAYSDLQTETVYHCPFATFVCVQASQQAIPPPGQGTSSGSDVTNDTSAEDKPLLGLSQVDSPSGRYSVAYTGIDPANKTRSFKLSDSTASTTHTFGKSTSRSAWDLMREGNRLFSFSPDEKFLVYLDDRSGVQTLYQISLPVQGNIAETKLITKSYTVADFLVWDSNTVFFIANKDNPYRWDLYRYDLRGRTAVKVAENVSYGPSLWRVHDLLMFTIIHTTQADPTFYDPAQDKILALSIAQSSIAPPTIQKPISIGNVSAVLMPAGIKKPHPLIIWLHGGPHRQTSVGYHSFPGYNGYEYVLEQAQSAGASVLKLDYTGSFGYGTAFAEDLYRSVGKADVADVKNAVDYMRKKENISAVYLMGNSYGGYLAMRSLVAYQSSFDGAITIAGVSDWGPLLTDLQDSIFNSLFDGPPSAKNKSLYAEASIFDRLSRIKDQKIMVVHGEDDNTIPLSQGEALYTALINAHKNAALATYPLEDHVFVQNSTILDLCMKTVAFVGLPTDGKCK